MLKNLSSGDLKMAKTKIHDVVELPLDYINLEDESFKFRLNLREGELVDSIKHNGQQLPIIVRGKKPPYQIVSGFRRVNAIKKLEIDKVQAIVRNDLDDEQALLFSYIENENRKSYSDLDRGYAIVSFRNQGKKIEDISQSTTTPKRGGLRETLKG
jgi:ParB family chromosome partitioning protein